MEIFNLKNNIKVLFKRTHGEKLVSVKVWTPVATLGEMPEQAGIASLTPTLMSKSTTNRSAQKLVFDLESLGANFEVSTDHDCAGIDISFLSQYFDNAMEILADIFMNPAFNKEEIEFEKESVVAALSSTRERIETVVKNTFRRLFYAGTPYSYSSLGTVETVKNLKEEDLRKWHQSAFNASNLLISAAGNIDSSIVKDCLEKYFGEIKIGEKFKLPPFNLQERKLGIHHVKADFKQGYVLAAYPAPNFFDKDFASLKLCREILGGRMTSRLFIELREKLGLAYSLNASYPARIEQSYFAIYLGVDRKNIDLTLSRIDEILKDICQNPVGEKELSDSKRYMKGTYLMSRQTVKALSFYYGHREILGQGYEYDDKYIGEVEKKTSADVLKAANRIFKTEPVTIVLS